MQLYIGLMASVRGRENSMIVCQGISGTEKQEVRSWHGGIIKESEPNTIGFTKMIRF